MVILRNGHFSFANWFTKNRDLLVNSASLVGTLGVNSMLGFVYWWYAAKVFAPEVVGAGSAAIAALTVLSTMGVTGMTTLLIGKLPTYHLPKVTLLIPAAIIAAGVSMALALGFAALAQNISPDLKFLAESWGNLTLFAVGVAANAVAMVIDAAAVALLHGMVQFWRNLFASVMKLALLVLLCHTATDAMFLYWTWAFSLFLSLAVVLVVRRKKLGTSGETNPNWKFILRLWPTALAHHMLNITLEVPPRALPLLVTAVLGAAMNASFFIAWMIALLTFSAADSLTMVIYAIGAGDPTQLAYRMKTTLKLSLVIGVVMVFMVAAGAPSILGIFGDTYSQGATETLRISALAVFPISIKDHYIAIQRVSGRIAKATRMMMFGAALEIGFAFAGASLFGLQGLAVAWVLAVTIEAVLMSPLLYRLWAGTLAPNRVADVSDHSYALPQRERFGSIRSGDEARQTHWLTYALRICLDSSLGFMVFAIGNTMSRLNFPWAEAGFWVGLAIFFAPLAYRLFTYGLSRHERLFLVTALGLGLYLFKVLHSPTQFTFTDEILHVRSIENILRTGKLFEYNPLLPISADYPGFENALTAFIQVGGLSTYTAGIILVGLARMLFSIALFLFYEKVSGSDYVAGIASIVYTANPFYLFVTVQVSYESLGLPLAAFLLYLLALRNDPISPNRTLHNLALWVCGLGLIITHHLTTYMLIVFLCIWLMASLMTRSTRKQTGIGILPVLLLVGGTSLWLYFVATATIDYMYPQLRAVIQGVIDILQGGIRARQLFAAPNGRVAPISEQLIAYGAVVLLLVGLGLGLIYILRRNRHSPVILALATAATAYPVSLGLRFTDLYPITTRTSEYMFVAMAYVVAIGVAQYPFLFHRWRARLVMTGLVVVIFLGGIAVGWSPWARQPGEYLVASEERSIELISLLTSQWTQEYLGTQNTLSADRVNAILLSAYGYQNPVDTINSGLTIPEVYFSAEFGPRELGLLCAAQIRYVVVDKRLSTSLPMSGTYFWLDEPFAFRHETPIAEAALSKFDSVSFLSRIFDAGWVVIYDTHRLNCDS